ncbi:MAG: alkA, partial [Microbacterium sp.]|nr:alkA [Microbacterium sp.]
RLQAELTALRDLSALIARVRRLFDLDADPVAIDEALAAHPELRSLVARVPGVRLPAAMDADEMLVRAMVGQQISVASARTVLGRLTSELGEVVDTARGPAVLFPTPDAIAARGADVLRGPGARVRAIVGAATALADGTLRIGPGDDPDELRAHLLALPGVGPWTADYVRMRVLGDPDVLLPGDVAARSGAAAAGIPADARGLTEWATRTAPWRSYLMAHLWYAAPVTQSWRNTPVERTTP